MEIPSFDQLLRVAPTAVIIIAIVGVGYFVGFKSRDDHIATLRDWINDLRKK